MGLFTRNDEDYLDPDEIRLMRESEKRRRREHQQCVADHSDDYTGPIHPANNTKPHDDCHADHSADNPKNNKVIAIAVAIAIFFMLLGLVMPIIAEFA